MLAACYLSTSIRLLVSSVVKTSAWALAAIATTNTSSSSTYKRQEAEPLYLDMWNEALDGIKEYLITYTRHSSLTVLAERPSGLDQSLSPKMDHLVCFMPGTIALAVTGGKTVTEATAKLGSEWTTKHDEDLRLAEELMKTCWGMYKTTATRSRARNCVL